MCNVIRPAASGQYGRAHGEEKGGRRKAEGGRMKEEGRKGAGCWVLGFGFNQHPAPNTRNPLILHPSSFILPLVGGAREFRCINEGHNHPRTKKLSGEF